MKSTLILAISGFLAGCSGREPRQPTPFVAPDAGTQPREFDSSSFAAGETSFVLGASLASNTVYAWNKGAHEAFTPVGAVKRAMTIEGTNFGGYLTTSTFSAKEHSSGNQGRDFTILTALEHGGKVAWRLKFGEGSWAPLGASRAVVASSGKLTVVDLRDGKKLGETTASMRSSLLPSALPISDDRWLLSDQFRSYVLDTRTFAIRCEYDFGPSLSQSPRNAIFHVSYAGSRPRLVRLQNDCAVETIIEGIYAGPTLDGTAIAISRVPAPETPFPLIVQNEPATNQLVEIDSSGIATRTMALPEGRLESVLPMRDFSSVLARTNGQWSVTRGGTADRQPIAIPDGYAFSTVDGRFAFFSPYGSSEAFVVDLQSATVTKRSMNFGGTPFKLKGALQSSVLLASTDGSYLRVNPSTWDVQDRITPR